MTDTDALVERLRDIAIMDVHKDSRIGRAATEAADTIAALEGAVEWYRTFDPQAADDITQRATLILDEKRRPK